MANEYTLRCSLCGATEEVSASAVDQIHSAKEGAGLHICDLCKRKVQHESEQKFS